VVHGLQPYSRGVPRGRCNRSTNTSPDRGADPLWSVVSASHYDGATATAEGAMMAVRQTRRGRILVSRGVHPIIAALSGRTRAATAERPPGDEIPLVSDGPAAGTTDLHALGRLLAAARPDDAVAGVLLAQPNFLGLLEPMAEAGALAHAGGAKFLRCRAAGALGRAAPPGDYGAGHRRRRRASPSGFAAVRWALPGSLHARTSCPADSGPPDRDDHGH